MPVPTQDTNHATEEVGLLTSRYISQKAVSGMAKALGIRFQQIENDYWSLLNGILLTNAPMAGGPWDIYDKLGSIVGVARNGRNDTDYIAAIRLQIRIDRSQGLSEDIIDIAQLVAPTETIVYYDWPLYAWEIDIFPTTADVIAALQQYLHQAAAETSAANIRYTTAGWGPLIEFGDSVSSSPGAGFGDSVGGGATNVFASLGVIA